MDDAHMLHPRGLRYYLHEETDLFRNHGLVLICSVSGNQRFHWRVSVILIKISCDFLESLIYF